MGTSRRRTPPGARLRRAPEGRPDRLSRHAKNEQIAVWFQVGNREIVRSVRALKIIQLSLANHRRFTKWIDRPCCDGSLIGSTREGWYRGG
jgi:hypothetical protein